MNNCKLIYEKYKKIFLTCFTLNMRISPIINQGKVPEIIKNTTSKKVSSPIVKQVITPAVSAALAASVLFNDNFSIKNIENNLLKHGYQKNSDGNFHKTFSDDEKTVLEQKYGKYSDRFQTIFEKPISKKDLIEFKKFMNIDKNSSKELLNNNFEKFFQTFCVIKHNNNTKTLTNLEKNGFSLIKDYIQKDISKNSIEDILDYKLDAHYGKGRAIQSALKEKYLDSNYQIDTNVQKNIDSISNAIDKFTLPNNLILYRVEKPKATLDKTKINNKNIDLASMMLEAAKSGNKKEIDKIKEFVLDNEITAINPRFMSTSLDNNLNKTWGKDLILSKTTILWKLTPEENTKGLYVESFNPTGQYTEQNEVLLQKGSKMTIKSVDYDAENKIWTVNAKVSN